MVSGIDPVLAEYRSELEAVLSSREFVRSPSLAKLLRYLCEKSFSGRIQEIKEFSIATEVFGRDRNISEKGDTVVRVEVHRLRKIIKHNIHHTLMNFAGLCHSVPLKLEEDLPET
jgi:hypothetical protein